MHVMRLHIADLKLWSASDRRTRVHTEMVYHRFQATTISYDDQGLNARHVLNSVAMLAHIEQSDAVYTCILHATLTFSPHMMRGFEVIATSNLQSIDLPWWGPCVVELVLYSYPMAGCLSGTQLHGHEVPKRMKRHMTSKELTARAAVVRAAAYAPIWTTRDPFHGIAALRPSHSCSLHSSCSDRVSSTCTVQTCSIYLR